MDDGLRERKKRRTRQAIIDAALELCELRGVEDVTVADIAAAAEVSRRTFFNYFASREEAILGGSRARSEMLAALVRGRPAEESPWTAIGRAWAELLDTGLDDLERDWHDWLARARLVRANPSLLAQQRADFARMEQELVAAVAIRTGEDPTDLGPRLLVAAAVATVRVAFNDWLDGPGTTPMGEALQGALDHVGAGLDRQPSTT